MGRFAKLLTLIACAVLIPAIASAQGAIAGIVKDASGAVLPGVTIEAASPALIEKVRSVISGTFRSIPGPEIYANYVATNAVIAPSLGRSLSGGAANLPVTMAKPGTLYGERLNQVDMRVGKILRFGRTKTSLSLDVYNLFNANTVLTANNAFATWQRPTSILLARFAKIGMQFDFQRAGPA